MSGLLDDFVSGVTTATDFAGNIFNTVTGNIVVNAPTGLSQSQYDFKSRVFPEDLANDYNGHYMVLNINIPVNASGVVRGGLYNAGLPITSTPLLNEYSKVDNLRFNPQFAAPSNSRQAEQYALQRSTRRIAESIALHMPTPVIFSSSNVYEDVSLTSIGGQIGKLGVGLAGKAIGAAAGALTRRIDGALRGAQAGGAIGDAVGNSVGTAFQLAGYPINPRIEVLFATTVQRQFTFEVLMAPRNEKESESMKKIIETIRFHAAPEISSWGPVPTYIPPAEFDITFYNKGVENTNIPRINTCVLSRIDVDYAPSGQYATFRNGYPVAVRLGMQFQEVEVVHKLRVQQGF